MPFFDNLTKKVGDAAKTAAKKSGDLVETTKLNMAINSEEDKIKAIYGEIGKCVYLKYQSGADTDPELLDKCQQITSIEENIASLRQKIAQLKNSGYNESNQQTPQYGGMPPAGQQYQQAPPQYTQGYNPVQSQAPPQYVPTGGIPESQSMPQYSPIPSYSVTQMQPQTPPQSAPASGNQEFQTIPQYSPVQEAVPYQAAAQDTQQPGGQSQAEAQAPQEVPSAQPNVCPSCGASVLPGTRFCPSCGSKLS